MKISKILGAASAAVVSATVLAASASAYEAFLMYTDANWAWGCWSTTDFPAGNTDVTTDGTYTVYIDSSFAGAQVEDEETGEMVGAVATGAQVFCVDIEGLSADYNAGKGADGYEALQTEAEKMAFAQAAGIEVSDVTVTTKNADGTTTDVPVDQSKIFYGDIEGNGKLRIEIFNAYGDTSKDSPIDTSLINFDEAISVTFTISGLGGDAADATDTNTDVATEPGDVATDDKPSPETGVEGVAVVAGVAVLAAGAVLVSKKRK